MTFSQPHYAKWCGRNEGVAKCGTCSGHGSEVYIFERARLKRLLRMFASITWALAGGSMGGMAEFASLSILAGGADSRVNVGWAKQF